MRALLFPCQPFLVVTSVVCSSCRCRSQSRSFMPPGFFLIQKIALCKLRRVALTSFIAHLPSDSSVACIGTTWNSGLTTFNSRGTTRISHHHKGLIGEVPCPETRHKRGVRLLQLFIIYASVSTCLPNSSSRLRRIRVPAAVSTAFLLSTTFAPLLRFVFLFLLFLFLLLGVFSEFLQPRFELLSLQHGASRS